MCVTEEIELPHAAQDVIYLEEQFCQILEVKTRKPRGMEDTKPSATPFCNHALSVSIATKR